MSNMMDDITYLSQEIGPRPAGTEEEQQAALYIADQIKKRTGFTTNIDDFNAAVEPGLVEAICFGVAAACSLLAIIFKALVVPAFLVTLACALLYVFELMDRPVLSRLLERGVSQNVVTRYRPATADAQRGRKIVLVANYDSGKVQSELSGGLFGIYPLLLKLAVGGLVALPAIWFIRSLFLLRATGTVVSFFNVLAVIALLLACVPVAVFVMHRIATYNEAANSNAAGTAVLMEVARRISDGCMSEEEIAALEEAEIQGKEEAYAAGAVPQGAQLEYDEDVAQTEEERLAAAKAAVAALTGQPLRQYSAPDDSYEEDFDYGEYAYREEDEAPEDEAPASAPAGNEAAQDGAPDDVFAIDNEGQTESMQPVEGRSSVAEPAAAERIASQDDAAQDTAYEQLPEKALAIAANTTDREEGFAAFVPATVPSLAKKTNEPSWYTAGRAKAVKPAGADDVPIRRSRYADALDAAVAASKAHMEKAARMLDEGSIEAIGRRQASAAGQGTSQTSVDVSLQELFDSAPLPHGGQFQEFATEDADDVATESDVTVAEAQLAEQLAEAAFDKDAKDLRAVDQEEEDAAASDQAAEATEATEVAVADAGDWGSASADDGDTLDSDEAEDASLVAEEETVEEEAAEAAEDGIADEADEADEDATEDGAAEDGAVEAEAKESEVEVVDLQEDAVLPAVDIELEIEDDQHAEAPVDIPEVPEASEAIKPGEQAPGEDDSLPAVAEQNEPAQPAPLVSVMMTDEEVELLHGRTTAIPRIDVGDLRHASGNTGAQPAVVDAAYGEDRDFSQIPVPDRRPRNFTLPTVDVASKQPAPLSEDDQPTERYASLASGSLPRIAADEAPLQENEDDGMAANKRAALRNAIPSLSGSFKAVDVEEDAPTEVSKTGSFAAVGSATAFDPVGDELVADLDPEDRYVEDADDSSYEENVTESGAFAGPDYVEMPESRIGRLFDRFRRKKDTDVSTTEWLDVDENFNATEVGAARGSWESFRPEDLEEDADMVDYKDDPAENEQLELDFLDEDAEEDDAWNGGAFSQIRAKLMQDAETEEAAQELVAAAEQDQLDADSVADAEDVADADEYADEGAEFETQPAEDEHTADDADEEDANMDAADDAGAPAAADADTPNRASTATGKDEDTLVAQEVQLVYNFRNPQFNTEVWFVALGSEMSGNGGMKAFLEEHAEELRGALFVNLESLGAGTLSFVEEEGFVFTRRPSSRMKRFLKKAAEACGLQAQTASIGWRDSAASLALRRGYQAMTLAGMEDGKPALLGQGDDVLENISEETLEQNVAFVMELIKAI